MGFICRSFLMSMIIATLALFISATTKPCYAHSYAGCELIHDDSWGVATPTVYPWGDVCGHPDRYCENIYGIGPCKNCYIEVCFLSSDYIYHRLWRCNLVTKNPDFSCGHHAYVKELLLTDG